MLKSAFFLLSACMLASFMLSCGSSRKAVYFNNMSDSTLLINLQKLEPVIHKNDLLSISVSSSNPELTMVFNKSNSSGSPAGYLVDQDGKIDFPLIGRMDADGLTKKRLKENITGLLKENKLLLDPIVDVRYMNYRVSILGEVSHPMVITVPNERINLLEAISMAGDLTLAAKRDNVMLIREEEGQMIFRRLNLNSAGIFQSPYYYLNSNDILYIEPNQLKIASNSRFNMIFPIVITSISLAVLLIDRIVK